MRQAMMRPVRFKPIPDEEGTETLVTRKLSGCPLGFKPIPDEEGTETISLVLISHSRLTLQTDPR